MTDLKVWELLSVGRENAKTAKEIAALLNIDKRAVTEEIHRLRVAGRLICSDNSNDCKGFFLPKNTDDVERFCFQMNSRIKSIKTAVKPAERYLELRGKYVSNRLF